MSEKITVTYEIPAPPEGWVYDGGRKANAGELHYMGGEWLPWDFRNDSAGINPVAVRERQWRPATAADVGRTDTMFRNDLSTDWVPGKLIYILQDVPCRYVAAIGIRLSNVCVFEQCEVPTEPTK